MMKALKLAVCLPGTCRVMLSRYLYCLYMRVIRPMTWLAKKYPIDKIWIIFLTLNRKYEVLICIFSPHCPDIQITLHTTVCDRIVGFLNFPCLRLMYNVLALALKKRPMNIQGMNDVFLVRCRCWYVLPLYHNSLIHFLISMTYNWVILFIKRETC